MQNNIEYFKEEVENDSLTKLTYVYNNVDRAEIILDTSCDEEWVEILYLKTLGNEREGWGTKAVQHLLEKTEGLKIFGCSRPKYIPFWQKLGAVFHVSVTEDDVVNDQTVEEEDTDYFDFEIIS